MQTSLQSGTTAQPRTSIFGDLPNISNPLRDASGDLMVDATAGTGVSTGSTSTASSGSTSAPPGTAKLAGKLAGKVIPNSVKLGINNAITGPINALGSSLLGLESTVTPLAAQAGQVALAGKPVAGAVAANAAGTGTASSAATGAAGATGTTAATLAALAPPLAFLTLVAIGMSNKKPSRPVTDLGNLDSSKLVELSSIDLPGRGQGAAQQGSAGAGFVNATGTLADGSTVSLENLNPTIVKAEGMAGSKRMYNPETGQVVFVRNEDRMNGTPVKTTAGRNNIQAMATGGNTPINTLGSSSGFGSYSTMDAPQTSEAQKPTAPQDSGVQGEASSNNTIFPAPSQVMIPAVRPGRQTFSQFVENYNKDKEQGAI